MAYHLDIKPAAERDMDRLPAGAQHRAAAKIDGLADNPRPPGSTKLAAGSATWRVRVGDYRVVYEVDDERQVVTITRVRHRRDVYR